MAVRVVKWLVLACCVLLLWYWWQCYLLMASGGGLLAQKPALPRFSVVVPLSVSVDDASYSVTGAPTISAVFIDRVLSAYGSPAAALARQVSVRSIIVLGTFAARLAIAVSQASAPTRRGKMAIRIGTA